MDSEEEEINFIGRKKHSTNLDDEAQKRRMPYKKAVVGEEREKMLKFMSE